MGRWKLVFASIIVGGCGLVFAGPTLAVDVAVDVAADAVDGGSTSSVRWEDFDDPGFDPTEPRVRTASLSEKAEGIPLGPLGVDSEGIEGRIHTVARGETLWHISEAYLGTPWVWPSVWRENAGIDNPHQIEPGDNIWITSTEMRRISQAEVEVMLTPPAESEPVAAEFDYMQVADIEVGLEIDAPPMMEVMEPELPIFEPLEIPSGPMRTGQLVMVGNSHEASLAPRSAIEQSARIVDSSSPRVYLTQGDSAFIGLGEGEVSVGDEFTIFRQAKEIRDPETHDVIGYHVEALGWLTVREVQGETATARIDGASGEMQRGDRLIPREYVADEVAVLESGSALEGKIAFMPGHRRLMGTTDTVYLNLGSIHGVEVGTKLEVYEHGGFFGALKLRLGGVKVPDAVIAEMVVIGVEPEVSIGYILGTRRELEVGDGVRTATATRLAVR